NKLRNRINCFPIHSYRTWLFKRKSFSLRRDLEHNLAPGVMRLYLLVRLGNVHQWKSLRHNWRDLVRLDQLRQLLEHFSIGMRTESRTANAMLGTFSCIGLVRD